jgi:hypothetical protein
MAESSNFLESSSSSPSLRSILNDLSNLKDGLNCESNNLSSILLKSVNIILLESSSSSRLQCQKSSELNTFTTTSSLPLTAQSELVNSTSMLLDHSSTNSDLRSDYDYHGAFVYIVFIILWYAMSVVVLIVMQTRNNNIYYFENSYDSLDKDAHNVLKNLRERNVKKQALGKINFICSEPNLNHVRSLKKNKTDRLNIRI